MIRLTVLMFVRVYLRRLHNNKVILRRSINLLTLWLGGLVKLGHIVHMLLPVSDISPTLLRCKGGIMHIITKLINRSAYNNLYSCWFCFHYTRVIHKVTELGQQTLHFLNQVSEMYNNNYIKCGYKVCAISITYRVSKSIFWNCYNKERLEKEFMGTRHIVVHKC